MSKTKWIDTSREAKKVYNEYFKNNNDTLFLNGKWGSGKTTFLNEIFKDRKKEVKVKWIDLWRRANDSEVVQSFYKKLYPFSFYFIKGIVVIISLLILALSFSLGHIQSFEKISFSLLMLGLIISLNTYILKIDWESLFFSTLKLRVQFARRKKIVIIDDFDRISQGTQEVLYKIFNNTNLNKIQFIFVGHYINVSKSKTSYLQKIIDKRIELPYEIQPTNIWKQYNDLLVKRINKKRSLEITNNELQNTSSLFSIAVKENRVLRELNIFAEAVETVIMKNKKYDKVNLDQQLIVIYLYEFHFNLYENLISDIEFLIKEKNRITWEYTVNNEKDGKTKHERFSAIVDESFSIGEDRELSELIVTLFSETDYPLITFIENFPNYLINYQPNNLGSNNYMSLIENKSFKKIPQLSLSDLEDFYYFLIKNKTDYVETNKDILLDLSLYILENNLNIYYFFRNSNVKKEIQLAKIAGIGLKTIYPQYLGNEELLKKIIEQSKTFEKLDITQKIKMCHYYFGIHLDEINDKYNPIIIEGIMNFNKDYRHPSILLTTGTSLRKDQLGIATFKFEDIINKLSDEEFLYYLYYNSFRKYPDTTFKISVKNSEVFALLNKRLKMIDQDQLSFNFHLDNKVIDPEDENYLFDDITPI